MVDECELVPLLLAFGLPEATGQFLLHDAWSSIQDQSSNLHCFQGLNRCLNSDCHRATSYTSSFTHVCWGFYWTYGHMKNHHFVAIWFRNYLLRFQKMLSIVPDAETAENNTSALAELMFWWGKQDLGITWEYIVKKGNGYRVESPEKTSLRRWGFKTALKEK